MNGELPLHLFLKRFGSPGFIIYPLSILEWLLTAGPETVAVQDDLTGLYPFQLPVEASIFDNPSSKKWHLAKEQIEVSYELLKKCPELCAGALEGVSHEYRN